MNKKTVIWFEDEPYIVSAMMDWIKEKYILRSYQSPKEFIEGLSKYKANLLIIDIIAATEYLHTEEKYKHYKMDHFGFQIAEEIRQEIFSLQDNDIDIIIYTAKSDSKTKNSCDKLKIYYYAKGDDIKPLKKKIMEILK